VSSCAQPRSFDAGSGPDRLSSLGIEIRGAAELRHKESDRIATTVAELRKLGAVIEERPDGYSSWEAGPAGICPECAPLYPGSLIKASIDPFDYALRLRTGELVRFSDCVFHGEWVTLRDLVKEAVRF